MSTVLLDTHVVHWWSSEPEKLSGEATAVIEAADELAVSAISWFELAWLAKHERIALATPVRSWLEELARDLRTVGLSPAIADAAVALPSTFPGDPADRIIGATALVEGIPLVTADEGIRRSKALPTIW